MATKKQKRAAAQAKREEYVAKVKAEGLAAQQRDREERKARTETFKRVAERMNEQHRQILAAHGIHEGDTLAERMGVTESDETIRARRFSAAFYFGSQES